jgi:hypothetical protein
MVDRMLVRQRSSRHVFIGDPRWLVGAAVILLLAFMAVSHNYDLSVGPGTVRLERTGSR